jgi:hypothetical protein
MADDQFSLSIDTDWKKQAQEEKRKLAEEQQKKAAAAAAAPAAKPVEKAGPGLRGRRDLPAAGFGTLVQSLLTQALFYLGELARDGGEPNVDLDRAKHHVDTLSLLEEKTVNNLTPEEQHMLDAALYEARTRYVNVASQYI